MNTDRKSLVPQSASGLPRAVGASGVVVVTRAGLQRARGGMPWLRKDDIVSYRGEGGAFADLVDEQGLPVGSVLWDPEAEVRARLLATTRTRDPLTLLATRLERAEHRRKHDTAHAQADAPPAHDDLRGAVRLCHGDGDAVPGLFIDRFGDGLHVDVDSPQLLPHLEELLSGTIERQGVRSIVLRHRRTVELWRGDTSLVAYRQGRLKLKVDLAKADVRRLSAELLPMERLRPWARGRVLDVYANTGDFALHLTDAGASQAVVVDEHAALKEHVAEAAADNGLSGRVDVVTAEPSAWIKQVQASFDLVVCHPPHEALPREQAEQRAVDIAASALKVCGEGAIFCARSASASLDDERFAAALQEAGAQLRRRLQVLERLGPGPDHPTLAGTPMAPSLLVLRVLSMG